MGSVNAPKKTKKLITAYIIKDYPISIFFRVKTMMNAYEIARIGQSVW